jgi:NADH:ubiquinone oxidoreductase subunit E
VKYVRLSGFAVAACIVLLLTDYVVASYRAPRDDRIIKALQEKVKSDAALAPVLAAEQKRVTAARLARRSRDKFASWVLLAASALFLALAKQSVKASVKQPGDAGTPPSKTKRSRSPKHAPAAPVAVDVSVVDRLVEQLGSGKEAAIPLLQAVQAHYRYLPDEALRRICEITEITPAQLSGTSSFYGQFRRSPVGKHIVRVCHGTACHVAGARQVTDELRRNLGIPEGTDTDPARLFTIDEVACLGCCSLAPVLMVDGQTAGRLTPATACDVVDRVESAEEKA